MERGKTFDWAVNDLADLMAQSAFKSYSLDTRKILTDNVKPLAETQVERVYKNGRT